MKLRITPSTLSCDACAGTPFGTWCPSKCERNLVIGAWSASLHHSRDSGMIVADDYGPFMRGQVAKICARQECKVFVAHGEEKHSYLGFIAGEPTERVVYYCFVKELYRRHGIARALFAALGVDPSSRFAYPADTRILTDMEGPRLRRKIPLAIRDPAVARYPKDQRHRSHA